jgi:hypothetical protein
VCIHEKICSGGLCFGGTGNDELSGRINVLAEEQKKEDVRMEL